MIPLLFPKIAAAVYKYFNRPVIFLTKCHHLFSYVSFGRSMWIQREGDTVLITWPEGILFNCAAEISFSAAVFTKHMLVDPTVLQSWNSCGRVHLIPPSPFVQFAQYYGNKLKEFTQQHFHAGD